VKTPQRSEGLGEILALCAPVVHGLRSRFEAVGTSGEIENSPLSR
jgi:hypothetical protein